jgi:hypothetical protein
MRAARLEPEVSAAAAISRLPTPTSASDAVHSGVCRRGFVVRAVEDALQLLWDRQPLLLNSKGCADRRAAWLLAFPPRLLLLAMVLHRREGGDGDAGDRVEG